MRLATVMFLAAAVTAGAAGQGSVTPPAEFVVAGGEGGYVARYLGVDGDGFRYEVVESGGGPVGRVVLPAAAVYDAALSADGRMLYVVVEPAEGGGGDGSFFSELYGGAVAGGRVEFLARAVDVNIAADGRELKYVTYSAPPGAVEESFGDDAAPLFPFFYSAVPAGFIRSFRLDLNTGKTTPAWTARASSALAEKAATLAAGNAVDADVATAWAEGVEGPGIGESITIDFGGPVAVENVGIIPGYAATAALYWGNNRVEKARFELSTGETVEQHFDDKAALQYVPLSGEGVRWLKITILEAYISPKWNDTCISEITINYNADI